MSADFPWQAAIAVFAFLSFLLAAAGFYGSWVIGRTRGEDAAKSAKAAHERLDAMAKDVGEFKTTVARDYASNVAVEKMESRVVEAINRLGDRLDRWADGERPTRSRRGAGA